MRPLSLARALLAAFVAVLAIAAGLAPAANAEPSTPEGSIGIRLLDVPAKAKDDPRAKLYIVDNVKPGATITRRVQVTNNTGAKATVRMYAGPAQIVGNTFVPDEPGATNALTSWIKVDQPSVTLDNGETAKVAVTIKVPADAPEMEHYGVVWASLTTPGKDGGIGAESRVGVRVYLSVGAGNGPPSDFSIDSVTGSRGDDNGATVIATVTNTGGRAVDVSGTLKLTKGPGDLSAGTVGSTGVTIPPGASSDVVFTVPNSASLPDGPWNASVALQSGVHKHTSDQTVTFRAAADSGPASRSIALPLTVTILVVLAAAALGYFLYRRRRTATATGEDKSA
ncbi:hypothetical protein SAMN04488550_1024 [Gordonia malaquae]|uniref:Peptidase n=1 Tax=Gordonia malaquae NBRC 108250 TaxID=1223542 RepID=M3UX04_GORML|nr:hypothetical protein [Gordonia malaquae]GAC80212.1 hypothetical protein GM1_015_00860 [Gordonia malaquae NBRC 108250]SEB92419.1 hypothetical protein SAMN04488550_1024 [Gordonia malaquae]